jgi:Flp pilus assembly protein TadD
MKKQRKRGSGQREAASPSAPAPARPSLLTWAIASALLLLAIAVFVQVRSHDFVNLDDGLYVVDNANVRSGLTADNVRWAFTTGRAANWHPLTWISHQIDVSLFGMDAGGHHLTNLAWHAVNTLMLFGLLRFMTGSLVRSGFVAAFFAIHPAHVESVAWVSERKDVLSTFFWFATTWSWVRWTRRPSRNLFLLTLVLYVLGLMAKPMLITLPLTWLLLDIWPLERGRMAFRARVIEKAPFMILAVVSAALTVLVQQQGGAVSSVDYISIADRIMNAVVAYAAYLRMLVWPTNQAAFYPYNASLGALTVGIAAAVLIGLSASAFTVRHRAPFVPVGWCWFLGTLVPVIGLLQIGTQSHADRYTYVPYIGLFVALVWGAAALARRTSFGPGAAIVAGVAAVIVLSVLAHAQAATWRTSEALWSHAVAVTTGNARAHNLLGAIYGNTGRVQEAEAHFKEALRLRPDMTEGLHILPNLGRSLMAQGKVADALPYLERARALKPEDAALANELGIAYLGVNRTADAIAAWRDAVRLDPTLEQTWFMLGMTLAANGRVADARVAFSEVVRLNPSRKDAAIALERLR